MDLKRLKSVDWKILLIGISIPLFFSVLNGLGSLLGMLDQNFLVYVKVDYFFLVFLAGLFMAFMLQKHVKTAVIHGVLLGLISSVTIIVLMIVFALATSPESSTELLQQLSGPEFRGYLITNLLFQTISGALGVTIGIKINKYID